MGKKMMKREFFSLLLGAIVGGFATYFYYDSVSAPLPFDRNNDGSADTQYLYRNHGGLKVLRMDRNHDGLIDNEIHFDKSGSPIYEYADDDFDGRYDTKVEYSAGLMTSLVSNFAGQDQPHLKIYYDNGVISGIDYLDGDVIRKVDFSRLRSIWAESRR
jgi:hypothetical protein